MTNGGVVVFSKYPIVESKEHCFTNSAYIDSLSAKGIQYIKINKFGINYNIIATHLNASYGKRNGAEVRKLQIEEVADFIQALNLPTTEPVIFAGDMNVDPHINPDEYSNMVSTLGIQPIRNVGHAHSLVNRPGMVDYIMYAKNHRQPIQATCDIRQITYNGRDISDHYPIIGIFQF
jgi:phospholipase C